MKKTKKSVQAKHFDGAFDRGEDVLEHLDLASAKMQHPVQRINIDIPKDMLHKADLEAARIGVTRTSLFKIWIAEKLDLIQKIHSGK